jgi:Phage tail lysozyme
MSIYIANTRKHPTFKQLLLRAMVGLALLFTAPLQASAEHRIGNGSEIRCEEVHQSERHELTNRGKEKSRKPTCAIADRAFQLMDYLVKRNWTPAAAAIAAGNAEQESGIRADGPMGDPTVPGGSWGEFQWNRDRLARLKARYGDRWQTQEAQFEYFADEAEGKIPGGTAVPGWSQQKDLSNAGEISLG